MLRYIRWMVTALVIPPVLVVFEALIQPHLQQAAADKQLHLFVTRWWLGISEFTNHMIGTQGFWFVFGFLSGAVAVLWMVEWFTKPDRQSRDRLR